MIICPPPPQESRKQVQHGTSRGGRRQEHQDDGERLQAESDTSGVSEAWRRLIAAEVGVEAGWKCQGDGAMTMVPIALLSSQGPADHCQLLRGGSRGGGDGEERGQVENRERSEYPARCGGAAAADCNRAACAAAASRGRARRCADAATRGRARRPIPIPAWRPRAAKTAGTQQRNSNSAGRLLSPCRVVGFWL